MAGLGRATACAERRSNHHHTPWFENGNAGAISRRGATGSPVEILQPSRFIDLNKTRGDAHEGRAEATLR